MNWSPAMYEQSIGRSKRPYSQVIKEPQTNLQKRIAEDYAETKGPLPPQHQLMAARYYWLALYDTDGRLWPARPFQWQPQAKQWCHIGEYATGRDLDLRGWVVVGDLEAPDLNVRVEKTDFGLNIFSEVKHES